MGLGEVEKLRGKYDLVLDWQPYFLRPDTPPEGAPVPEYVKQKRADPNNPLKARAKALGLTMVEGAIIPSTRRAHEAAEFARARGKLEPMHTALLRRYWSLGEDLWSLTTLRSAAEECGLHADELQRAIEAGTYKAAVEQAVSEANSAGVRAVPTFLFDEQLALQGAQEYPVFEMVMQRLGRQPR